MTNILVTTLGSWQIVPELIGFTNPDGFDFFKNNTDIEELRTKHDIAPIDKLWIIATDGNDSNINILKKIAETWKINISFFICQGINDLTSEKEIDTMRSFIYRVVMKASEEAIDGQLYLSLTGGRKTMSADMQDAATIFGCKKLLHLVEKMTMAEPLRTEFKEFDFLSATNGKFSEYFMPVIIGENIHPNIILWGEEGKLTGENYPLDIDKESKYYENGKLAKEILCRKKESSQVYSNFYSHIKNQENERDIFRRLYFLHPDILQKLKEIKIGTNDKDYEDEINLLKSLPKADLHTHLGGVLSAAEIIEVAKCHPNPTDSTIAEILSFQGKPDEFDKHIFGEYINPEKYYNTGIDSYQKLGDYQGSKLLKTKQTLEKTVDIYARNLLNDNVKYVEIRCSPYNYSTEYFSVDDVVNCIMDTMDKYQDKITYRIICIIGREADLDKIKQRIDIIIGLINSNERFAKKLVGIDLAGNEGRNAPKDLRSSFMPFLERCIHITIHAGETEEVGNIWEAVYHLSADRIGHGLKLLDKEELIPRFIDKNIGIEMCPSSNRQIVGYGRVTDKTYPLKTYMEHGLKVTVNTDNQGISRTFMSNEFYAAANLCGGISLWDCFVLIRNSLIVSFADKKTKMKLLQNFENEIYEWCINKNNL
jgi:adenosine deaminase